MFQRSGTVGQHQLVVAPASSRRRKYRTAILVVARIRAGNKTSQALYYGLRPPGIENLNAHCENVVAASVRIK